MSAKYNKIGLGYNTTRKADRYIAERLFYHLSAKPEGLYLDIGCGTGNYTHALHQKGVDLIGIDPSEVMLNTAKQRNPDIRWQFGRAEHTELLSSTVDGIMATLTLHHWQDLEQGFKEMNRVLKDEGNMVIFTATPKQMEGYWLNHYFPKMLRYSIDQMPSLEKLEKGMSTAGFKIIKTEQYAVQADLDDLFLYSGKQRPELYLDPEVRKGISSFSALANAEEISQGLKRLNADIRSGGIAELINDYKHTFGDYLFIVAKKV